MIGYRILHHSFWIDDIILLKYVRLSEKLKNSENCQFFVLLLVNILILKSNNSNFRQFLPESNEHWPNGTSILPEMNSKLVAVLTRTKT